MSSVISLGLLYIIKQLTGSLLSYTRKTKSQYKEKDIQTHCRHCLKNNTAGKVQKSIKMF